MSDYDNEMSGVLFKNDKKTSEKHPVYKGQCEIDGQKYYISAWINEKKGSGEKYMKLAFELPQGEVHPSQQGRGGGGGQQRPADVPIGQSDFGAPAGADDDIPF